MKYTEEEIKKVATDLTGQLADSGRLVEAGFAAFVNVALGDPKKVPGYQLMALRDAYMSGAQHLYSSMMVMLDDDRSDEPTERDLRRMALIDREMMNYAAELKRRYGGGS